MKYSTILAALFALTATARSVNQPPAGQVVLQASKDAESSLPSAEKYLIEFGPGHTEWVTDDEKWALKRVCQRLGDLVNGLTML
jgi:leucyl aminopeptidase